jgi:hypothetical protein
MQILQGRDTGGVGSESFAGLRSIMRRRAYGQRHTAGYILPRNDRGWFVPLDLLLTKDLYHAPYAECFLLILHHARRVEEVAVPGTEGL